jgi:hypothetical protein
MAVDALLAIAQTVLLVVGFAEGGAVADVAINEAKIGVEQGFKKLGSLALKESMNAFKTVIAREGKTAFIKQVGEFAFDKISTFVGKKVAKEVVTKVCSEIGNKLLDKVQQSSEPKLNFQHFDLGATVNNVVDKFIGPCTGTDLFGDTNKAIACAQTVLNDVALVDPTGITALAASVMQPVCNGV